ncbi:MAG: hypothetical protein A2654_00235 [Candidatus Nealsonbacteria bacterium RIFCSPHIGHO2_01_FULL_43_31]|uniref:Uncharacterized protein n=1 Tax=Candidatus Nealsonbacteria bacterium RIFCSPHIGHO2_01_FULL_43_31 TaxID=1801665 RepID=A0A1G2E4V7_9BACT|nr:MAG: hypothetical protein A2654_00235 [Candidatus Nealsonbacteria bacterium RIFCSPHIGHO2_01_FULL_43_31]
MSEGRARYMMATKAIHKLGDISRDKPDLCVIHSEDEENYIGNWVTGFRFVEVKFPKATTRELTEEEKDKYDGMQIAIGDQPAFIVDIKPPSDIPKEAPIIVLTEDATRKKQLENKLKEYKGRMDPYRAPEMQMGTICKIAVLERLLRDGQVNVWDLSVEMAKTYGSGFGTREFNVACAVMEDYCKTGGKNLSGGTGLK